MGLAVAACAPKADEAAVEEGAEPEVKEEVKPAVTSAAFKASKGQIDTVSYLLGLNFGSLIKGYNFGDVNFSQIQKGMKDMANSKGNFRDPDFAEQFKISPEIMNEFINDYLQNRQMYVSYKNKEEGEAFLKKNASKPGVQTTASGLQYIIIAAGSEDVKAGPVDTVEVYYKGTLIDGTVFDEAKAEKDPVKFALNRVVKGWGEGLQLVGEGGEIRLFVPAELGYGAQGNQNIEPNSTLIFDVQVVRVGKVAAAE